MLLRTNLASPTASVIARLSALRPHLAAPAPAPAHFRIRTYSAAAVPAAAMADRVHRVTMFKMPKEEDRQRALEQYRKMAVDNRKDGKPYILNMTVGPAEADARSQGYTLVSKTEFASFEDMKYYDEECTAHQGIKDCLKALTVEGVLTVYFKPQATGGVAP